MDTDLICNFKKCRKRLNTFAWVTSCSHIFCDEDGTKEFNKCYKCPACETRLATNLDIIRIDLQPSEQYKSMVLAGQKPEVIMEICTRALSFWTYQAHQEMTYQEHVTEKVKDKCAQLEQYYEQIVSQTQSEIASLKKLYSDAKKNLDSTSKKFHEVSEKLIQKSRQYQKLQTNYESLRRRSVSASVFEAGDNGKDVPKNFTIPLSSGDGFLQKESSRSSSRSSSPVQRKFVMFPRATPDRAIQNKFTLPLGTPTK